MDRSSTLLSDVVQRVEAKDWKPRNCVWELTLRCNLRCVHCGSRAGGPRPDELSTAECLDVADELHELGCELVSLSGGEPTLRDDWHVIAKALVDKGILVNMVTNGVYGSDKKRDEVALRALEAGLCNVAVSIDGTTPVHDYIRGAGNFDQAIASVRRFSALGLSVCVMTTVNRLNLSELPDIRKIAMDAGATVWRLQLAKPMGALEENRALIIRPADMLQLIPALARMKKAGGIALGVGDSIGYYGPHDRVLRGRGWRGRKESWQGCQAGMQAIGIEADGGVKGCLSLQAKLADGSSFLEGNVRESSLADIWFRRGAFSYNREFSLESLTGGCAKCRRAPVCRGGARCVSSAVCGHLGEDPYCHLRQAADRASWCQRLGPPAQAAASALLLALGTMGCGEVPSSDGGETPVLDVQRSTNDLGFPNRPGADTEREELGIGPISDSGPDLVTPIADVNGDGTTVIPEPDALPDLDPGDTGHIAEEPPDVVSFDAVSFDSESDTQAMTVPPDLVGTDVVADGPDAIDCDAVCCYCEYGVSPSEEEWRACCEPDPCEGVCCGCDYGAEPPPGCCD